MNRVFRRFALCTAGALGLLVICPSTALASDFGGLVEYAIFLLAAMAGGALLLAVATEAILSRVYRRKWVWILIPLFAVGWFAVIWGGFQWNLNRPQPVEGPPPFPPDAKQYESPAPPEGAGR